MSRSSPPSADTCSCIAVRKVARHLTQHYDRHLAPVGLTVTQFSVLSHLDRLGAATINALASRLAMDRTTLGRTVRPLERQGLLAIGPDTADARRRALTLTPAGRERLGAARPLWLDAQARFDVAFGSSASLDLRAVLAAVLATDLRAETRAAL